MTDPSALLLPVLSLLASVIILRAVSVVTGGITFDSWGDAFGVVLIAYVVRWAAAYAMVHFSLQSKLEWVPSLIVTDGLIQLAVNFVSLVIASAVLSGVQIKGVLGLFVAAIALTAVNLALAYAPFYLPAM